MAARLTTYVVVGIVAATLIAGLMVGAQRDDNDGPVDLIVFNAKVYTADPSNSMAEAVAVRGNQILRVGSNREITRLRRPQTVVIDALGAAVLPGFNDTSTRFIDGGIALDAVDLMDAVTIEEMQTRVRVWAESHPERRWVVGRGWTAASFANGPTRQLLDAAVADRPAYLLSVDGRSAWLNTKALQLAGITRTSAVPPDGLIVKESRTGSPTGVLRGTAIEFAAKLLPRPSLEDRATALQGAIAEAHRNGITSVQETIDRPDDFIVYDEARRAGELGVRVYASVEAEATPENTELFQRIETLSDKYPDDPLFKMGGVKIEVDGPVQTADAAMLQPYEGRPDHLGDDDVDPDALNKFVRLIDARGWQVTLESTGDRAVRMALNALEHAARSNAEPERGRRHRIEGVAVVDAADVPRFGRLGAIAVVDPHDAMATTEHLETWIHALGPERTSRAWPCASIVGARGRLAFGTEWPGSPLSPLAAIQAAATRAVTDGAPDGGWSAERVTLKRAITAFTSVPAYASFDEQRKGSLQKGMLADLVVLSSDIFAAGDDDLPPPTVVATIFDGKIVYQRSAKSTN